MALFGKLFEKKECAICGGEIGLLGNRKLEDGNCCKNCAAKLSPWFSDRRQSTVEEIKEQLAYREANQEKVAAFRVTRTLGEGMKVLLDEDDGRFMVTSARNWQEANPDVLSFSDVTGCKLDIDESKTEIQYKDAEGKRQSFSPRRYAFSYDFYIVINVNNPSEKIEIRAVSVHSSCMDHSSSYSFTIEKEGDDWFFSFDAALNRGGAHTEVENQRIGEGDAEEILRIVKEQQLVTRVKEYEEPPDNDIFALDETTYQTSFEFADSSSIYAPINAGNELIDAFYRLATVGIHQR